jgi:two-component system phosphate regulon sensor histidine kinase PhoR
LKFILLHKQALKTSALIVALFFVVFVFLIYFEINQNVFNILLLSLFAFLSIYFIIKYSVKQFIYKQLKRVYKSALFENEFNFKKNNLETDFESFLEGIKEFTDLKHEEIEKLNSRDDFRREFLGDVAHELKTPLFNAQGYLLTLLDDTMDDDELQKKYLDRANKSIERLNFIVKDLDVISRLESGMKLDFEPFNIVKLITDVFEMLEIKASKKNIALTFDEFYEYPILVQGDNERIEQVLINLISNSITYGKNNGTTTVSIGFYTKEKFIIKVTDNGLGINKIDIPRLFERFYRIDKSRSREQGGSGLGLAIVKHIVEAHNQEVFVESKPKKGSTFSFTLDKVL